VDFYLDDLLNADILTLSTLRANPDDVYRKASDGDNFAFFIHTWNRLPQQERVKWKESLDTFTAFVSRLVGPNAPSLDRYLPVVQHHALFEAAQALVRTPWGRSLFSMTNVYRIIGCHLDHVSFFFVLLDLERFRGVYFTTHHAY